jgi:DNA-binding NtrC family response regulator
VINVRVPPLRERREEILPLAEFLLRKHAVSGEPPLPIRPALAEALIKYHWPGNVRELENMIRKLLIL